MEETSFCLCAGLSPTKGHNFTLVYPSTVQVKLEARKCIILPSLCINLKDEVVFLLFSNIVV